MAPSADTANGEKAEGKGAPLLDSVLRGGGKALYCAFLRQHLALFPLEDVVAHSDRGSQIALQSQIDAEEGRVAEGG